MDINEQIAVMQAFDDGKLIQTKSNNHGASVWCTAENPRWNWLSYMYRVHPNTPDQFDWAQVSPKYNAYARDRDGEVYFYGSIPELVGEMWHLRGDYTVADADVISSLVIGTIHWTDTLQVRPGHKIGK